MTRKRGVARKSFARRRARRVKKYDHNVIPKRFKIYLPRMSDLLETELPPCVLCEEPTMALLLSLGVPTGEWQYYLGFMKRMVELYLTFTSETLQKEKDSIIAEYVYRGKDKTVLEQVQAVSEVCAGIVVSCTEVKACLEGDYSSYAVDWMVSYDPAESDWNEILQAYPTINRVFITNTYMGRITIRQLSDGTLVSVINPLEPAISTREEPYSLLKKYYAYVVDEGGVPQLKIYKDGTLLQTLDLSQPPTSWVSTSDVYITSMTPDGKYILVNNTSTNEYALIEGS